ncbi:MAG TPA: hypothetical protein VGI12_20625 [Vicinamibacterales bacterium]|jgi:hypothetical protein
MVSTVSAHRRDEYLQAARLAIDPGRVEVELDLTPGIALADRIISEIDRDRDGVVSDGEARAYAEVLERQTALELDGRPLARQLLEDRPAGEEAMTQGEGTLRLRWTAALPTLAAGTHRLRFINAHHTDIGVYLANVMVPSSSRVAITGQDRDIDQRHFTVEYEVRGGGGARPAILAAAIGGVLAAAALAAPLVRRRRVRAPSLQPGAPVSRS